MVMVVASEVSVIPDFYLFYLRFSKKYFQRIYRIVEKCHHIMSHVISEVLNKFGYYLSPYILFSLKKGAFFF